MKIDHLTGSQQVDHLSPAAGMQYSLPPHLLAEGQWRQLVNMRVTNGTLEQYPRYRTFVDIGLPEDILAVASLPSGVSDYSQWLALSATRLYQLRGFNTAPQLITSGLTGSPTSHIPRWHTAVHNNRLFFVNPLNRLRYTDGAGVYEAWNGIHSITEDSTVDRELFSTEIGGPDYPGGPFTKEPFFVWNPGTSAYEPLGYLNAPFTWTTDTLYRVYVQKVQNFAPGQSIRIVRNAQSLTGLVIATASRYIVVKATNTVADVTNEEHESVWRVFYTNVPDIPAGRYCTIFFDHAVVAALPNNPSLIRWSDLYNYANWRPSSASEADSRLCTDYQREDDVVTGITGIHHYREQLLILTPSCIYAMAYTGLPRIIRIAPLVTGYGNGLPYASAALHNQVVWCDVHNRSFFAWRGQGPEDFGAPIASWFFSRLSTNSDLAAKTWCYVDRLNSEVGWVYCAADAVYFNEAVVYNWAENAWSVRSGEPTFTSHGILHKRVKTLRETSAAIVGNVAGSVASFEQTADTGGNLFGGRLGLIYQEAPVGATLQPQAQPVIETGDLLYGSVRKVKEVHTMALQVAGTHSGVQVEVSTRDNLSDTVTYVIVGTWTSALPMKELTFPTRAGRILRYRFTPLGTVRDFKFYGYTDNIMQAYANR